MTTVLISGASGGLGRAFAEICAKKKYDLVLTARNEKRLEEMKAELEKTYGIHVYTIPCDLAVSDRADVIFKETEEKGIDVDILINNAGFGHVGPFVKSDWKKQADQISVNITSLMRLCYLYGEKMAQRGSGRILNLSSVAAFSAGLDMSVYYASKAFVLSFSIALNRELRNRGVTVSALCPGPTATGFEQAAAMKKGSRMFQRAADPYLVAEKGMDALERKQAVVYPAAFVRIMNLGSRISPRMIAAEFASYMNH